VTFPRTGDAAPDLTIDDARGETLRLSDWRGHPVVLVFLRHLGCPICRMELAELRRQHDAFARLDARVVVFVDATPDRVASFAQREDVALHLVGDGQRRVYEQYGVRRGGLREFAAPGAALRSVRATLKGHLHGRFEGSERQLPADLVIDGEGIVRFAHLGAHIGDNTPLEELLEQCRRL